MKTIAKTDGADASLESTVPFAPERFRALVRIRAFEETLLDTYRGGKLRGTTHTCLGQEAVAVAVMAALGPDDLVFSNHRGHGHFLAYGGGAWALLAEIAGRSEGVCGGVGGSQHVCWRNFLSNGVQGGLAPVGAGAALAERIKGSGAITVVMLGDGTFGEGALYEAFNIASLWSLPVLFVVEDNRYAQTTPVEQNLAGSMIARPRAFGIESAECDGNDLAAALSAMERAVSAVRSSGRPFCQILHTYRLGPHSRGDDFRDRAEIDARRERDPLLLARRQLPAPLVDAIESEERAAIRDCFAKLERPDEGKPIVPSIADVHANVAAGHAGWIEPGGELGGAARLRQTFTTLMEREPRLHLVGEDILDPSGGAFTIYRGISTRWPERVHATPISEAAIAGLGTGMALRGLRPVVEFMFADFLALAMDQILNHLTKFAVMYSGKARCPVILRTPPGGFRGYGPTHSQSPEKYFIGIPGLTVTALSPVHDPLLIWQRMLELESPCLHLEGKLLYGQSFKPFEGGRIDGFLAKSDFRAFPTIALELVDGGTPDVVLAAYGEVVPIALEAARQLFVQHEKVARVVVPSCLSPLPAAALVEFMSGCRSLVTLEEGTVRAGWGSALIADVLPRCPAGLRAARVGGLDTIIPASAAGEAEMLPSLERALAAALEVMGER